MEPIPVELQLQIEHARRAMLEDPQHLLAPFYRDRIYRAIGPDNDPRARLVRGWLGLLAARKVLPIWLHAWSRSHLANLPWPDDIPQPERLLKQADAVLAGIADSEVAEAEMTAGEDWIILIGDENIWRDLPNVAYFAGWAAVQALREALGYHPFADGDVWIIDSDKDEFAIDPESSDTARWAAYAWAGRARDDNSDIGKRKEFWEWWLGEAIPTAWAAAVSDW